MKLLAWSALAGAVILATGCSPAAPTSAEPDERATPEMSSQAFAWPPTLRVFGDGYPETGDVCRRIGESAATIDWLDDASDLVGCPASEAAAAAALGGRRLTTVDGVVLLSVPHISPPVADSQDARVPGTRFHAKGQVRCRGHDLPNSGLCEAGVVRREDRSADIVILQGALEGPTVRIDAGGRAMDSGAVSERRDELVVVMLDGQTFEIPTALIWGG